MLSPTVAHFILGILVATAAFCVRDAIGMFRDLDRLAAGARRSTEGDHGDGQENC